MPLWFLGSLFFVKLCTFKLNKHNWWVWGLIGLSIALLHNLIFSKDEFVYFGNISLGIFCYVVGYKLNDKIIRHYVGIMTTIVYVCVLIVEPVCLNFFRNHTFVGSYYEAIALMVPGILSINYLFGLIPCSMLRGLSFIGKNSMIFLVSHQPAIIVLQSWGFSSIATFILILILGLILHYLSKSCNFDLCSFRIHGPKLEKGA